MRVAFIGSNPSHLGPDCPAKKTFHKWWSSMELDGVGLFFNVSNEITPGNRPLKKSEYELERLKLDLSGFTQVVALGNTAADALDRLGIVYFKLPHPSPRNRKLNDKTYINALLRNCKDYLENK
jgi:hypothetical protein